MSTRPPTLLAVFAHPDDESYRAGGTLAEYAARGARVHLAVTTRGEAGSITDPDLGDVHDVGALREQELRDACRALGIEAPTFLGYRDSGLGDRLRRDDPLASINADPWELEQRILDVIRDVRPHAMLTFDPHGVYGHPDHLVVHRAATAAFHASGHLPDPPERLFYVAVRSDDWAAQQGRDTTGPLGGLDAERYGVAANAVAVTHDIRPFVEHKRAAMRAHRSQNGPRSALARMPEAGLDALYSRETFSLAGARGPVPRWPLRDMFDGIAALDAAAAGPR